MTFHLSIDADDPQRVASALAALWGCEAYPIPPVADGSWVVLIGDRRGTAIEVYRRGLKQRPGAALAAAARLVIATPWSEEAVHEIAMAEGWSSTRRSRGGIDVIEVCIENRRVVEVLTEDMQARHVATVAALAA